MQDLTQGSIPRHLVKLALPIAIGMLFQTLYYLVDLYFVAQLGDAAIAGVSAAGNVQFLIMALTQILGAGTMALISHASGRKDREDANLIFNQSLLLAAICAVATLVGGYGWMRGYMGTLGADAATQELGVRYLTWVWPGMALQFALVALGSALRGTGIAKPTMVVQMVTVLVNAVLSPVLITGWLIGKPLGVAGAALATTLSIGLGVVLMFLYFIRLGKFITFEPTLFRPRLEAWRRILKIGLPPGGEFALIFVYMAVVYWIISGFGAAAQAGFGIGTRVMQSIFLPAMALSFATAPVAGQNFGAGLGERVRETFRYAAWIGTVLMVSMTLVCQWRPDWLIGFFTDDAAVIEIGQEYLRIISWNFIATGLVFTASGMFQALGNTVPALLSSATRLVTFALPGIWLASQPGFTLRRLWFLSVVTVALQALLSLWLLRGELQRRLQGMGEPAPASP